MRPIRRWIIDCINFSAMDEPSGTAQNRGGNSNWIQFWLLLWKNWLLLKKKAILTLLILVPPIFYPILIFRAWKREISSMPIPTIYDSFFVTANLTNDLRDSPEKLTIVYAPNTALVARIVDRAATLMGVNISPDLGFASENVLEEYVTIYEDVFGAIVFGKSDWDNLPKDISYTIRLRSYKRTSGSDNGERIEWKTNDMTDAAYRRKEGPRDDIGPVYRDEGFLAIQKAIDLSLIVEVNRSFDPTTMNVTTQLRQYPFPPYSRDPLLYDVRLIFPSVILISFILIVPTICYEIVLEKETKFKESMKVMGMRSWLYWSSWFVKYLLIMLILISIMTVYLHASREPALVRTSAAVTFVFLLLYSLSLITFCFAVSTLLNKASYGSLLGVVLFVLSFVPYFYLEMVYGDMPLGQKILASFDFNLAMGLGFIKISQYEALGIGADWSTLWCWEDGHTMGHILLMLLVDTIIHSILTWYLDAVMPTNFGTPQPYYFPFLKEYWIGKKGDKMNLSSEDSTTLVPENRRPYFEAPVQDAKAAIRIRGLTKNFGSEENPAVNNLNVDFYEGSVTALVGHSGAGKTTTMFMLTGYLPPSKGTAFINGFDITRDMDKIRRNLGLCPQHNILYDELTVKEHLLFFAILKGSSCDEASLEVNEMLRVLHMEDKIKAPARTLSRGEKRKLSVGIALISGSKFALLDEPTSGLDPESRRQIWDILQSQRKDRTIILSTHCMDEADLLGDRIAIMYNGDIQCYGTPMFLKSKYGVGYHLTIVKTSACDVDRLRDMITSQIPTTRILKYDAEVVKFVLPSNEALQFEGLFKTIETDSKTLGIESFEVSVTTLEEVFLKVNDWSKVEGEPTMSIAGDAEMQGNTLHVEMQHRRETGFKLQNLQLRAMLYKRFIHSIRNYQIAFSQLLIIVVSTLLACSRLLNPPRNVHSPPRTLDLTHFKNPITPYDVRSPQSTEAQKLATCYVTSVLKQSKPVLIKNNLNYATDDFLIDIGKYHKDLYTYKYQIGATIEEDADGKFNITGYFNNEAYHTIAISLSYLGNTLMQCFGNKEYHIETINHPLPSNSDEIFETIFQQKIMEFCFFFSICISFGLALLFPTFLIFLIRERKSGAKHCQLVGGVRLHNVWLATFLWDYVNYLVPCVLIVVVVILCFQTEGYWQHVWIVLIGLMLYGFAMLPLTYVMSFFFDEASVGFIWLSIIYVMTGPLVTIIGALLQKLISRSTWKTVEWIFYIFFPTYCLSAALQNICDNHNKHNSCTQMAPGVTLAELCLSKKRLGQSSPCCLDNCGKHCIEMVDNYLSFTLPGVGRSLVLMGLQGIVFFLVLYIIETNIGGRLVKVLTPNRMRQATLNELKYTIQHGRISEELDLGTERLRIQSHPIQELVKTDAVVTQDLTKLYGNFVAVNQLSIGVSQKECFGLLGVNGAGKTTVFKMLTGEIRPSFGNAYIAGIGVQDDLAKVRQKIGYCPQVDSFIDQLTVHETLRMYALAHGIPDQLREEVIDRLIERLALKPHTKEQAGNLSGGNKRKLCVAVALMGNPTVVFLDEPSTGVDPEARRHVWNTLADARRAGTTIIFTSHSLEECESICTRMGILVNGRFLCLGSLQHLRDKLCDGYTITIKLKRSPDTEKPKDLQDRNEKLMAFVSHTFPESVLKDHHENLFSYQVKTLTLKWSEIFEIMERARVTYEIDDYTVGQTTLEQIFIGFARMQREPTETSKKRCFGLFCDDSIWSNYIIPTHEVL